MSGGKVSGGKMSGVKCHITRKSDFMAHFTNGVID